MEEERSGSKWYWNILPMIILVGLFITSFVVYYWLYNPNDFRCLTDPSEIENHSIKLDNLHLSVVKSTFGFISPPMVSRALAMVNGASYNALSVYIPNTNPIFEECSHLKDIHVYGTTCSNKKNIEYAMLIAVKKMVNVIYETETSELNDFNNAIQPLIDGYIGDYSHASNIGHASFRCVLDRFEHDGANQLGDEPGTTNQEIYSDYTNYYPVNPPQDQIGITNCSRLVSLNHWQQIRIPLPMGGSKIRNFLSPHMGRVKTYALINAYEVMPPPPPQLYTNTHQKQLDEAAEVLKYSRELTEREKVIAEYWADGPSTKQPPGHWKDLTNVMAVKHQLDLVKTTKLSLLQSLALLDAAIASWAAKREYDFARPLAQLQCLYKDQQIKAWKGPYMGTGMINGSTWKPYQNQYFVTPPFAEYVSGHSTFSRASAVVLRKFLGTDKMQLSHTVKAGESYFEPKITVGNPGYIAGVTDIPNTGPETVGYVPATDVTLYWETFTEASAESGISRLYGGIHFKSGNIEGLKMGDKIGEKVYNKFSKL